jgi:maltooligosyltrehalose synthase
MTLVDVIWVSPSTLFHYPEEDSAHLDVVYKSPQVDMGYDISDYMDIDPKYGTLGEVDELIAGLRKRDMKLMMDLVVNHTSNEVSNFANNGVSKF